MHPFSVYQCAGCALRYIDPCLSPTGMQELYSSTEDLKALNQFHATYYDYGDPGIPSRTVKDFERALGLLEEQTPASERSIFDVGCGNGLFLAVAKRRGWKVDGCEPGASQVASAKQKFGVDLACTDFLSYEPQGKTYDAISFWDVLEHLTDPHAFIRKAALMLKPGGLILAGGPNDRSFLKFMATFLARLSFGAVRDPLKKVYLLEHVSYYTIHTLTRLFETHGMPLAASFQSSTDLEKYAFDPIEKMLAATILKFGKLTGLQNRIIAVFRASA